MKNSQDRVTRMFTVFERTRAGNERETRWLAAGVIRFWIRRRILSSERNFIFFIAIFNFSGTCFHYKIFLYLSANFPKS